MINERVKELRKELNLTMEKFGERLGVRKTAISRIESGVNNLTEQMFLAICREFGVNEEWLRDGEGEMFIEDSDSIINKILCEIPLDTLSQTILKIYIEMDPKRREAFNSFIKDLSKNLILSETKQNTEAYIEKEQFLKLAEEQFDKEKERELRASFAKESDAG